MDRDIAIANLTVEGLEIQGLEVAAGNLGLHPERGLIGGTGPDVLHDPFAGGWAQSQRPIEPQLIDLEVLQVGFRLQCHVATDPDHATGEGKVRPLGLILAKVEAQLLNLQAAFAAAEVGLEVELPDRPRIENALGHRQRPLAAVDFDAEGIHNPVQPNSCGRRTTQGQVEPGQ